jgi:hypothetical protein
VRELYKICALGVQFGMGAESLAERIGKPVLAARDLLRDHHRTYSTFWQWSDAAEPACMACRRPEARAALKKSKFVRASSSTTWP